MEDLKQIQEFFSKPLEEMMSLDDQAKAYYLAKVKSGEIDTLPEDPKAAFLAQMTKDQMAHDKETLRRERGLEENKPVANVNKHIKAIQIQLDKLGVKYEMSGNPYKPFKAVYKPINKDDKWYDNFEDIIFRYNLGGVVKTSMNEGAVEIMDAFNDVMDLVKKHSRKLSDDDSYAFGLKLKAWFNKNILSEEKKLTYNDFVRMVRDDMMAGASPDERSSKELVAKRAKAYYNDYLQGASVDDLFEVVNEISKEDAWKKFQEKRHVTDKTATAARKDFDKGWDEGKFRDGVYKSVNEEIKKGDKVSKKYASTEEDYTKKFEVISVENGRAKVKDLKTGKITGMALSDLTTEALGEVSAEYTPKRRTPKVGDIVGNTVQGFDFKVLDIQDDLMKVKNFITGKEFMTDIDNMSLLYPDESINEAKFTDYSNNELAAYAKELSKQRADAASKGQNDLVSGINKEIEAATRELKKRSQALKNLSRTDVNELDKEISNDYSPISYAKLVAKGRMDIEDAMKETGYPYVTLMNLVKKIKAAGDSMLQEAFVPRNIAEFAERKGVSSLVKTVASWAEKVGKRIVGGTAIGKNYDTLILDMTYQGSEIRINTEYETVELYDEPVRTFAQFKRVYEENQEENLDEAMGGQLDERYFIEVSVRDARKALDIYADEYRNTDIETYGSNVYASNDFGDIYDLYMSLMANGIEILDSSNFDEDPYDYEDMDDELLEADMPYNKKRDLIKRIISKAEALQKSISLDRKADQVAKSVKIDVGNSYSDDGTEKGGKPFYRVLGGTKANVDEAEGYSKFLEDDPEHPGGKTKGLTPDIMNKILMKIVQDVDETKQLGEGVIEEDLCPKGKAYIKKRMAAGEKSSAYLSGRAVKVCKGQMKG